MIKLSVWQGWYQCCIFAWFVLWWHFEPWYWARLYNSWREKNMHPFKNKNKKTTQNMYPLIKEKKKMYTFSWKMQCCKSVIQNSLSQYGVLHVGFKHKELTSLLCIAFLPSTLLRSFFLLFSVMSWRWRASSSSLWQWRERSGSSTHCATCTIRSPSLRLSSSATPRERSECWKPL